MVKDEIIDIPGNLPENQLADVILRLINKCDANNPEYDPKLDEEMVRIGLSTDRGRFINGPFINGDSNHGGTFYDYGEENSGESYNKHEKGRTR